jgi:crotonobetainyl-CoA:carnitine CoA-transferase CaiB-like acyl-CoA transferase
VNTVEDLLASPHLAERNFFREVDHPDAGALRHPGSPSRMPATPPEQRPAPRLGAHTRDVLTGLLEMSPRDLALLSAAGVI